ncbi:diguanylate cyclase domain-containing protein [Pseudoxanthomonas mexicana]|uniref:diguanylate cyclase domain-containing protein n=1 Tax=Pseudoxanthomonas mexicana TaxID=128785 RepID=UPI00398B2F09
MRNSWSLAEGLPQLSVIAIAQDKPGYLWFGTQAGLSRFDGARFVNFDRDNTPALPSTWIQALQTDLQGRLWIGTPQGLAVHEAGKGFSGVPLAEGEPAAVVDVNDLDIDDKGTVLVASSGGVLAVADGRLVRRHPLPEGALALLPASDGALWIGSRGAAYAVRDGEPRRQPLPAEAATALVRQLAEDAGRIWAGSSQGLFGFDGRQWRRHEDPELGDTAIESLYRDRDGNLWAATAHTLYRLHGGRVVERAGAEGALQSIRAMYEDREANLWLGSGVEGVSRVWNGWTRRYSRTEGLETPLLWTTAIGPDGRVWVGGDDGVSVLADGHFRQVVAGRDLPHASAYSLLPERDGTWIGTRSGVALYRGGRLQPLPALKAMDAAQINGILRDRQQRLWFATSLGLYRLDEDGALAHYGQSAGLADPRVRVLHQTRDGRLLAGTQSGLYEWRDGRLHAIALTGTGLDSPHVTALHELPGGQWLVGVLSEEELLVRDGDRWTRLDKSRGIPVNAPFFMADDARGFLWVGGLRGIYRVPIADLLAATGNPTHPVRAQTLLNERGDRHGGQKGDCCNGAGNSRGFVHQGALWLPSRDGVVVMDMEGIIGNRYIPESVIERVQVGPQWRPADPNADWLLPRQARDLRFEFTTLSFQASDHIDIRYRLAGYDADWRLLEDPNQRSATYTNLPAGRYVFEVIGTNNSGLSSRTVARLPFSIAPYFYESPWFYVALAVGLLSLLLLSNRWLLRRHLRQRSALEELVEQRTRDLRLANQRLEAISLTDPLTGLHNRRYMAQQIPIDLAYHQRDPAFAAGDEAIIFALLDVDQFKSINDNHGHQAGDQVLQQIAGLLRDMTRQGEYVVRWGGEEFLMVFRPMPRADLAALGQRLCMAVAAHRFDIGGADLQITASLGLIEYPLFPNQPDLLSWEQLVSLADRALYQVKQHGRNGWAAYRPTSLRPSAGEGGAHRLDPGELIRRGCLQLTGPHHPCAPPR